MWRGSRPRPGAVHRRDRRWGRSSPAEGARCAGGVVAPSEPGWSREDSPGRAEVIGHGDLFWTNVIFRDGSPVALIDWEIARPMTRTLEVALAATYWAGLRIDRQLLEWGLPLDRRGERLRILCDSYGLDRRQRGALFGELIEHRRNHLEQRELAGRRSARHHRRQLRLGRCSCSEPVEVHRLAHPANRAG